MTQWARLLGGIASSPGPKQDAAHRSDQRLAVFKRTYHQLDQAWRRSDSRRSHPAAAEVVRLNLERLAAILQEESAAPVPHRCFAFALSCPLSTTVSGVALAARDEGSLHAAISIFGTLLESEDESVEDEEFARSLMVLVKGVKASDPVVVRSGVQSDVVELLFGVATKIRLQPGVLSSWFKPKRSPRTPVGGDTTDHADADPTHEEQFPLFYALMDYVHYESPVGDFARTGLLYIIESASNFQELEHWMVDCDLATLMASGLGALYSQLHRKLILSFPNEGLPAILALSDYADPQPATDAQSSDSPEFRIHMETFLSYLLFWQDVLEHCSSVEVKRTLLDHFQVLFLQQLLYPSILESSDIDGGSSVAVLTYLCRILESLHHPALTNLVLRYLLGYPQSQLDDSASAQRMPRAMRRRKTLDMLVQDPNGEEKPSPTLFSLVDLVIASLSSENQQTVAATLRLVSVLVQRHHAHTLLKVLRTSPVSSQLSHRTIGAHTKEMEIFLSLALAVSDDDGFDESYDVHLADTLKTLELHSCSAALLATRDKKTANRTSKGRLPEENFASARSHTLKLEDPILRSIMTLLETFFANSVEINLGLTGAVISLASCRYTRLEGWILVDPAKYIYHGPDGICGKEQLAMNSISPDVASQAEEARILAMKRATRPPSWSTEDTPPILRILRLLVDQIHGYRSDIPNFDELLVERKRAFQLSDKLDEAFISATPSTPVLRPRDTSSSVAQGSEERFSPIGSISKRFFGNGTSNNSSRSGSPRGRRPPPSDFPQPHHMNASRAIRRDNTSSSSLQDPPILSGPQPQRPRLSESEVDSLRRQVIANSKAMRQSDEIIPSQPAGRLTAYAESDAVQRRVTTATEMITINHLLTNVILLQEFILELAALIQVRASLFEDVKFL